MGAAASQVPQAILRGQVQLHFKAGYVKKDVAETLDVWFENGGNLALTYSNFKQLLVLGPCNYCNELFDTFDTDTNKKIDALEVLSVLVMLAEGTIDEKMDAIFPVYDFAREGKLNFDEAHILMHSFCRGLHKVCDLPCASEADIVRVCKLMFDSHNLLYDSKISKEQMRRWVHNDDDAARFVAIFHRSRSIHEVEAVLAEKEQSQAGTFSELCGKSAHELAANLLANPRMLDALGRPSDKVMNVLSRAMTSQNKHKANIVKPDHFAEICRAWNAFSILDEAGTCEVHVRQLPLLLYLRDHQDADATFLKSTRKALDLEFDNDAMIELSQWLQLSLEA